MHADGFRTSFTVNRTPQEVYDAITDVRAWWTGEIEGRADQVGAEFTYRYQDLHRSTQKVTELAPGRRVAWRVTEARLSFVADQDEWVGTDIVFDLLRKDGDTEVRFTHTGLLPSCQCYQACSAGWTFYLHESLQKLLSAGRGAAARES